MPPNNKDETFYQKVEVKEVEIEKLVAPQAAPWKYELLYYNIAYVAYLHLSAIYGAYLLFSAKWTSLVFVLLCWIAGNIGMTAGAHRLWSHRAYKAKTPLQILLMLFFSMTMSLSVVFWVQTHRRHHKFADTDGDPHNAARGFFFSHIGWFMVRRHPECAKRRKFVDISDIFSNPVLKFQKRYSAIILVTAALILPVSFLVWVCGESFNVAWHINMFRIVANVNSAFMINSLAHLWGSRPYDKKIQPTQNLAVTLLTQGEGFHNYHHTFPWDYKAAELGNNWMNLSTRAIDFFAWIGWAYDLQTVSPEMVAKRAQRTGDGSWELKVDENHKDY